MEDREYEEKIKVYRSELLTFTVGIGPNIPEAEAQSLHAKNNKLDNEGKIKLYNISSATQGESYKPDLDARVLKIMAMKKAADALVDSDPNKPILIEGIKAITVDPETGLYTGVGVKIALHENAAQEYCFMLLDANDMHGWNARIGYSEVDKKIATASKGIRDSQSLILDQLRIERNAISDKQMINRRKSEKIDIASRVYDSELSMHAKTHETGDEFIIAIPMKYDGTVAEDIARRILKRMYTAQIEELASKYKNKD